MRNIGLDVARSLAINFVLLAHISGFYRNAEPLTFFGVLGVEIFFALSGFLVGTIIIRDIIESNGPLLNFYFRRWMRTLPLYYAILPLIVLLSKQSIPYEYLFFLQTLNPTIQGFLPQAWSLATEEWFYFLTPLATILLLRLGRFNKKQVLLTICIFIIIGSLASRIAYTIMFDPALHLVKKQAFFRLDAIIFGVMVAILRFYRISIYDRINKYIALYCGILGIITLGTYYVVYDTSTFDHSFFARTFYFTLLPISCAIFIIGLEKSKITRGANIFTFISNTSYCVYLIHLTLLLSLLEKQPSILEVTTVIALIYGLAYLSYKFFESPILLWRDRVSKTWQTKTKKQLAT